MAVTINGSTGIAGVDGSAGTPAVQGADSNTGIFFPAADTVAVATGGSERMRIDSSGNVGIGTTVPADCKFAVSGTGQVLQDASGAIFRFNKTLGTDTGWLSNRSYSWHDGNGLALSTQTADPLRFGTNGTERARIDSSGIMLIGATSARTTQAKLELRSAANTALSLYMFKDTQVEATLGFKSSTDSNFYVGSGSTSVGTNGVYLTNTGSSWNAVSDERKKTIVEPIANAAEKVASLRAVIGYYNHDENQIRRPFLIAQDVQAVLPEAVNIQDPETGTLGMSYTDTIPLLVAAIKEQQALIAALQADVAALKGAQA